MIMGSVFMTVAQMLNIIDLFSKEVFDEEFISVLDLNVNHQF